MQIDIKDFTKTFNSGFGLGYELSTIETVIANYKNGAPSTNHSNVIDAYVMLSDYLALMEKNQIKENNNG